MLRRGMRRAAGFAFHLLLANDLGRVEVLRRLEAWSGMAGMPELNFLPEGEEGVRALGGAAGREG